MRLNPNTQFSHITCAATGSCTGVLICPSPNVLSLSPELEMTYYHRIETERMGQRYNGRGTEDLNSTVDVTKLSVWIQDTMPMTTETNCFDCGGLKELKPMDFGIDLESRWQFDSRGIGDWMLPC